MRGRERGKEREMGGDREREMRGRQGEREKRGGDI